MMTVREITDRNAWDAFVLPFPEKTFLHSWQWGEFQRAGGSKIWRFAIESRTLSQQSSGLRSPTIIGVALIIKIAARRGTFLFCPHGPIIAEWGRGEALRALTNELRTLAQKEGAAFLRITPVLPNEAHYRSLFAHEGFRDAPTHMHAETTWTLDLRPSLDELLAGMRKTTRNLIRRGEREGIAVVIGTDAALIEQFDALQTATVSRQHFVPFSKAYMTREVNVFLPDNILIAIGSVNNEPRAGAIIPISDGTAYYHHGASIPTKEPVPYLLQWHIIESLKRRGIARYNFWGIAPTDSPKHPWHGLTLFKQGFGGYRTDYLHAQDYILSPLRYWPTAVIERTRRWWRGL